jgi:DUF971 family protein
MIDRPLHLDLKKDKGLTVHWRDGSTSFYPMAYLRRMSPSADARHLRAEMKSNPLTVLPSSMAGRTGPVTALSAEMVGHYAIRIRFSDGHSTGIFSWSYLREIDRGHEDEEAEHEDRNEA